MSLSMLGMGSIERSGSLVAWTPVSDFPCVIVNHPGFYFTFQSHEIRSY